MRMSILTDVHTHTKFSSDGKDDIFTMLAAAKALPLAYWGISEHFDYDYLVDGVLIDGKQLPLTDAETYFTTARKLQAESKEVKILVGGEFGFTRNQAAYGLYHALIERYKPDFIVNSVHTNGARDFYEKAAYAGKDKMAVYGEYLALVRDSLDAPYPYDIVGHIGYPSRFAPYQDKALRYNDFAAQLDDILKTIIQKDKILELNSSVKGLDVPFLPAPDIAERYFALGGRNVSFASDAHGATRLADAREGVVARLKQIGFTYLTVPYKGQKIKVEI